MIIIYNTPLNKNKELKISSCWEKFLILFEFDTKKFMPKSKKNGIFGEISKYPYCSRPDENEDYLSEKICQYTIRIHKKITRKTKQVFIYGQLIFSLGNGLAPTQTIGLPILLSTQSRYNGYPWDNNKF